MNDKLRKLIRAAIVLIGIVILAYPSLSEFLQQRNSSRAIAVYDDTVNKTAQARLDAMMREAIAYNKLLAASVTRGKPPVDSAGEPVSLDRYDQILNINGNGMIGYVIIPKLNSTNYIFHGTKESVLQTGVGHMKNSSFPVGGESTHAVLSAHTGLPSASLFSDLNRLKAGDVFYIKVLKSTLCYTVDRISTVLPDQTEELAIKEGKDYVTLVTCTPYGVNSHRLLVRGVRTPFDDTKEIPAVSETDLGAFWYRLPVQYRHMLIGACAIIVFLILWFVFKLIKKRLQKRKKGSES